MVKGTLGRLAFLIGLTAAAGAVGCFISEGELTTSTDDEVVAGTDVSGVLKSTLILDDGCIATKVGPRHLLVAARCVANKPAFGPGKTIGFKLASGSATVEAADAGPAPEPPDAGTENASESPSDGGAQATDDAGTRAPNRSNRQATISEVVVHTSYANKCQNDACGFHTVAASDAKDIAVIVLDADLETIPTLPVDLDEVKPGDPVLAVASGCAKLDGEPRGTKTVKTIAVPETAAGHEGSPYKAEGQAQHLKRLDASYVVTPGIGWRADEIALCKNDIGAPLFRADHAAVIGVTSNFTAFDKDSLVPVTVHHTRVDTPSRVGAWLESLGVETTKTCSEAAAGCVSRGYDGGVPVPSGRDGTTGPTGDDDAGPVAPDGGPDDEEEEEEIGEFPTQAEEAELGPDEDPYEPRFNDGSGYDAGTKKKKKKQTGGCSATAGTTSGLEGGLGIVLGLAAIASAARRRRR